MEKDSKPKKTDAFQNTQAGTPIPNKQETNDPIFEMDDISNDLETAFDTFIENKPWNEKLFQQLYQKKQEYLSSTTTEQLRHIDAQEVENPEIDISKKKIETPKMYPTHKQYMQTHLRKPTAYDQQAYCDDVRSIWKQMKAVCTCDGPRGWCRRHNKLPDENIYPQLSRFCKLNIEQEEKRKKY